MRWCLCLLCVAVALLLPLPAMSFCSVPRPRLVCAEYFASQLVVEATLVQTGELHDKDDPEGISAYVYTLRVNRALRGKITGTIRVYEGNDSGRATFGWVPGRDYLLFLFYAASEKSWELDGCGNSCPLSEAGMALSEIAAIKAARGGGVIHGVLSEQALSTPIPGVHVEARGATGRYVATTNEKGEFQLNVPAGRYIVRAAESGFSFDTADISYEDRRNIRIEPGRCAQVQLAKVERPPVR
jgi:carboxypeptidase family protein